MLVKAVLPLRSDGTVTTGHGRAARILRDTASTPGSYQVTARPAGGLRVVLDLPAAAVPAIPAVPA